MVEQNDERLVFLPENEIMDGGGLCDVMRNRWFSVCPERGLIFWQHEKRRKGMLVGASAQCNGAEATARAIQQKMYPWAEMRFYECVIVPINIRDYA